MAIVRSKSKQNIIDHAFVHFVQNGYEGASLNAIAEAVGIRKASLYTHFKSKEALFLELLDDALAIEMAFLTDCFSAALDRELPGECYLQQCKARYETSITSQFLTRMAYVPPVHLVKTVSHAYQAFIAHLSQLLQIEMAKKVQNVADQTLYCDAYLGILDSLSAELLYDGTCYDRRLTALLTLYKNSLSVSLKTS